MARNIPADYIKEMRETFRMQESALILHFVVNRAAYTTSSPDQDQLLYSAAHIALTTSSDPSVGALMRTSVSISEGDNEECAWLTASYRGCDVRIGDVEVNRIHKDERDRLHALFLEMRGVEYKYTANLFGFLEKDGSDVQEVHKLTFPGADLAAHADTRALPDPARQPN